MYMGNHQICPWLVKWFKVKAQVPNLVGGGRGEKTASMERTSRFLEERQGKGVFKTNER